jgi:hypothetical protein
MAISGGLYASIFTISGVKSASTNRVHVDPADPEHRLLAQARIMPAAVLLKNNTKTQRGGHPRGDGGNIGRRFDGVAADWYIAVTRSWGRIGLEKSNAK